MDFLKNILIVDKEKDQAAKIKKLVLEASSKFSVFTLSSRLKIAEVSTQNNIKCLFLNANIGKKEAFYILRFFTMMIEKEKIDIPIFVTSEDFDLLKVIVSEFPLKNLQILHSPLDLKDLVDKIQIAGLGKINTNKSAIDNHLNVDLEFMNVFIKNTKKIIAEMAKIPDLVHSPPTLMSKLESPLDIAISAKILISSVYFKGSYYIAFPKETFLNFYEIVVMEKCTEINSENKDFASELANIIYGQCKKYFSNEGLILDMVIPSLHLGEINFPVVILIPFECSLGKFYLAIAPGLI